MKFILVIITIFLLAGCSTTKPPITEYRITTDSLTTKSSADGCRDKSLKISQAFSSSSLMSLKMDYGHEKSKIYSYSQAQWNESPNYTVTMKLLNYIRASTLFKNTQTTRSRSSYDLILETNIEDFIQYYSDDLKDSFVNIVISLTLIEAKTSSVLATKTFTSKVKTDTADAFGGVKALNSALSDILTQNIEWLSGVCK